MLSVNTNSGAMVALQYLNKTESDLQTTQTHINTGLKVATAKDNGATFAIAQNMRGNVSGYQAVSDSLNRGVSTVDVALSAGQSISDLLNELKSKALARSRCFTRYRKPQRLECRFHRLARSDHRHRAEREFQRHHLVDGSVSNITASRFRRRQQKITVAGIPLNLSGSVVTIKTTSTISTQAKASAMVSTINASVQNVNASLAQLAAGSKKFTIQNDFVSKLVDTLNAGIGNLVDADMAVESAKLQSLQVKQQLGVQALSIANSQPQIILSLFR